MLDLIPFRRRHSLPDMFREMEDFFKHPWNWPLENEGAERFDVDWAPRIDLTETDDTVTVKADLPGLEAKDLDISIDRGMLVIKGERKHEKEESDKRYHRIERSYGSFYRALQLPSEVNKEKIDATFKNGVLQIVLPKAEEEKKKITHVKVH